MANCFNPTALKLMEDSLADVFFSHHDFDAFIRRCGVDDLLAEKARNAAEFRKGAYSRSPKRFVAQEILKLLELSGEKGVHSLTRIFDALVNGTFPDATRKGMESLALLKELFEQDRNHKAQEEKAKQEWRNQRERESAAQFTRVERKPQEIARIQQKFIDMHSESNPHKRGLDFELLVFELLQAEALSPRHNVSRVGEQIDITFDFAPHTYMLEARWKKSQSEPKELRDFHGKCQGVHVDVRGVFISIQGYTSGCAESLAKLGELRVVMLDGTHLMSILSGALTFSDLLKKVIRKACDEGNPYVPVSSLLSK